VTNLLFSGKNIGKLHLKNRIIRSATYEGASDRYGFPAKKYLTIYETLAKYDVGMIITGFSYVSKQGKAMQTAQSGIDSAEKIKYFRDVTNAVHNYNCPIILQLAHTGRQTLEIETGTTPVSSTTKKSIYFREKPKLITPEEIKEVITQFTNSSIYAKESGFDGVQLHAGHGYLLHQFLLPETNKLSNEFGIDKSTGFGTKIIDVIIDNIKEKCGNDFPVLIKISGNHDISNNYHSDKFENLIAFLDSKRFSAIEISYGTMDYPLNIFRGNLNLDTVYRYNPIYKTDSKIKRFLSEQYIQRIIQPKFKKFTRMYNLSFAERAKKLTDIPIISVGGFRSGNEIEFAISKGKADFVSLSRPFICEPDFVIKLKNSGINYESKCKNCNECVFMCDSGKVTACYTNNKN